ncbi:MAG TPA: hypothetical protein VG028_09915 [Terriglobia bacterium]|nr:hypothetical protein [Terriglobia bacterium]
MIQTRRHAKFNRVMCYAATVAFGSTGRNLSRFYRDPGILFSAISHRKSRPKGRLYPIFPHSVKFLALVLVALSALVAPRAALAQSIKLYLKDGTYELVKSYEVHGHRVRFYSLDRSEWEEMPVSLVDFDATQRAQQQEKVAEKKELEKAHELDTERLEIPVNTGYEVAPGIHLPAEEGVFAFDGVRVIRLIQSSAEVVKDKKRAALLMALPGPLLKQRSLVVLSGAKAAVRILVAQPVFFVNSADGLGAKLDLIPVAANKNKDVRTVEKIQGGIGMGQSGETRSEIQVERVQLAPGLFKLKPMKELALGEYALGELMGDQLNLEVWDFGVDAALDRTNPHPIIPDRPPVIKREAPKPDALQD